MTCNACKLETEQKLSEMAAAFRAQPAITRSATPSTDQSNACSTNTEGTPCAIYLAGDDPCVAERRFAGMQMRQLTLSGGEPVFETDENGVVTRVGRRWLLGFPRSLKLCLDDIVDTTGRAVFAALERTITRTKANVGWTTYLLPAREGGFSRFRITDGRCFCDQLCESGQPVIADDRWKRGGVAFTAWAADGTTNLDNLTLTMHMSAVKTVPEPLDCDAGDSCGYQELECAQYVLLGKTLSVTCGAPPPPDP